MMAVPFGARVTCAVDAPTDGTVNGVPSLFTNRTGIPTVDPVRLVKYSAKYQSPPNANWGRRLELPFATAPGVVEGMEVKAGPSKRNPSTATVPAVTENCAEPGQPPCR